MQVPATKWESTQERRAGFSLCTISPCVRAQKLIQGHELDLVARFYISHQVSGGVVKDFTPLSPVIQGGDGVSSFQSLGIFEWDSL